MFEGRGGAKVREIEEGSGARIKVNLWMDKTNQLSIPKNHQHANKSASKFWKMT